MSKYKSKIEIKGRIPSKKNGKRRTGKFLISSKAYMNRHKENIGQLSGVKSDSKKIRIEIRFPDKRKSDLTNKAESIMDLLVDAGVIEDDSRQVIEELTLSGCYDKETPGATIYFL